MVTEGQPAPDFTLSDQDGNLVSLAALKGHPLVLYFYPKDSTPGCTTEACDFRDAEADYMALGAKVLGVSPDDVKSHAKFAANHALKFPLLADTETKVCELYGVWKEKSMYGKTYMGVERTTVIIDGEGIIRKIFPKVKVPGHSIAVLEALKAIQ
jgi:peroxiredoxin Q/BCP